MSLSAEASLPEPTTTPERAGLRPGSPGYGRSVAESTAVLLLSRLAVAGVGWILEVTLVRLLSPPEWELLSRFLTLMMTFTIAQLGFPQSVVYFAARSDAGPSPVALAARTSVLLGALGLVLAVPFAVLDGLTERLLGTSDFIGPLFVFVAADLAFSPLPPLLVARRRPRLAAILSLGTRLPILIGAAGAALTGASLEGVLYGIAVGGVLALVIGWIVVRAVFRGAPGRGATVSLGEQTRFALPVGLTRFVQVGNIQLDKYIVLSVFAEGVFGSYYLGATEFALPGMICTSVTTVLMADLVMAKEQGDYETLQKLWHASVAKVAAISLPIFGFVELFADELFVAIYGAAHRDAATQFRVFQLMLLLRVSNYTNLNIALGQPRVPLIAASIALTLNAAFGIVLVQLIGITGPAVATVTAVFLSTVYTLHAAKTGIGSSWKEVIPWGRYGRTLAVAGAATVVSATVLLFDLSVIPTLLMGALLHVGAYFVIGSFAGVIEREDRAFLRALVGLGAASNPAGSR